MLQLSLFSADLTEPRPEDLGGLLAAHGQATTGSDGTRISILLDARWRADALLKECRVRDVPADAATTPQPGGDRGTVLLRTDRQTALSAVALAWSRGAVKSVPDGLVLSPGMVRCWTLAAGRRTDAGFLLGLDPHAPDTHQPLAAACSRAGIAGAVIGMSSGWPAIRVIGRRRTLRLVELLGTLPPGTPPEAFPAV